MDYYSAMKIKHWLLTDSQKQLNFLKVLYNFTHVRF